jgi:hypothetical protein
LVDPRRTLYYLEASQHRVVVLPTIVATEHAPSIVVECLRVIPQHPIRRTTFGFTSLFMKSGVHRSTQFHISASIPILVLSGLFIIDCQIVSS